MSFWVLRVADGKAQGPAELIKQDVGRRILPMGFTREGSLYFGLETAMEDVYIASLDFEDRETPGGAEEGHRALRRM